MLCALALLLMLDSEQLTRYSFHEIAMGCDVRIEVFAPSESVAVAAARGAFGRVHALDEVLSDYVHSSEVNRLPRTAQSATVISADLAAAISHALEISRATAGAFDVTTGALSHVWREARRTQLLPSDDAIAAARAQCGFAQLTVDRTPPRLTFACTGMRLDFGGIGKGFAAQSAVDSLRGAGLNHALCAIAGDIACGDAPPESAGWSIQVDPQLGVPDPTSLRLCNASISTSGDASQYLDVHGVRYAHIYDPRTGRAVTRRIAATVVSRSGAVADALATALCVDGNALLSQHARLVEKLGPFEARIAELGASPLDERSQSAQRAVTITATPGWQSIQESQRVPAAEVQTEVKAASDSSDSPSQTPR